MRAETRLADSPKKAEIPAPEPTQKAEKDLQRAQDAQPMSAAKGALAGGIAATTVGVGAFYVKAFSEFSKAANKIGKSIYDLNDPCVKHQITSVLEKNPKALANIRFLGVLAIAAPFVGAAAGSWFSTKRGVDAIKEKQSLVNKTKEQKWQEKIGCKNANGSFAIKQL